MVKWARVLGTLDERIACKGSGMVVHQQHIWIGEGRIKHLKDHFINHCVERLAKDETLSIRQIEREYGTKQGQIYQLLSRHGIDRETTADIRNGEYKW